MTHEELVEKVAVAISGAPFPTNASRRKARAAIAAVYEAMKEPSHETLGIIHDVMFEDTYTAATALIGAGYDAMLAASPMNPET